MPSSSRHYTQRRVVDRSASAANHAQQHTQHRAAAASDACMAAAALQPDARTATAAAASPRVSFRVDGASAAPLHLSASSHSKLAEAMQAQAATGMSLKRSTSTSSIHSHASSMGLHAQDEELFAELQERGPLTIRRLQAALSEAGMHPNDPRLKQVHLRLQSNPSDTLSFDHFKHVIESASLLIYRALTRKLVIPDWRSFIRELDTLYRDTSANSKGHVASYIPELANADPSTWAVAFCSIDGQQHGVGDISLPFSLQSTSKPLSYLMALEELGEEEVHRFVGREPSGRNFNELCLNRQNIPHNPMINAGAIMVSSLIQHGKSQSERFGHILAYWKKLTGYSRDISFSNTVYLSEKSTANRNFCLGYLMQERKAFQWGNNRAKQPREWKDTDLAANLDLYFQCCSIEATTQSMSVVAATLANGGVCPLTGERVFQAEYVQNCLALMLSCGMYDYSGEWGFVVGLPAKSGVSGSIILVIPNVGGLALFSPRLDELGNSARGIEFSKRLAIRFGLHFLNFTNEKEKADATASASATAASDAQAAAASSAASAASSSSLSSKKLGGSSGKLSSSGFASEARRAADLSQAASAESGAAPPLIRKSGAGAASKSLDLSIAFIFACAAGDLGLVRSLMASAVDMNASDYDGRTALHLAASNGHLHIVQMLVRRGVELSPVDRLGGTPLADAIREGHLHVVNFLRQHHAQLADLGGEDEVDNEEDDAEAVDEGESDYSRDSRSASVAYSEDGSRSTSAFASPLASSAATPSGATCSPLVKQQLAAQINMSAATGPAVGRKRKPGAAPAHAAPAAPAAAAAAAPPAAPARRSGRATARPNYTEATDAQVNALTEATDSASAADISGYASASTHESDVELEEVVNEDYHGPDGLRDIVHPGYAAQSDWGGYAERLEEAIQAGKDRRKEEN